MPARVAAFGYYSSLRVHWSQFGRTHFLPAQDWCMRYGSSRCFVQPMWLLCLQLVTLFRTFFPAEAQERKKREKKNKAVRRRIPRTRYQRSDILRLSSSYSKTSKCKIRLLLIALIEREGESEMQICSARATILWHSGLPIVVNTSCTSCRTIPKVKQHWSRLVLG